MAVEKLLRAKFAKIKSRQEAPQSIFSGRVDIFYPNFGCLGQKGSFSTATPVNNNQSITERGSSTAWPTFTHVLTARAAEIIPLGEALSREDPSARSESSAGPYVIAMLYAASRSGKQSEGCRSSLSTAGFTLMWNDARSRASFGPITLVNLSTVVLKSLACVCCNSIVIVMSNNPLSHFRKCCALCASKLPPSIRARLTSERLLHAAHSSPRLLLMTSQSRQRTAFQRGRTPASRSFLVLANIYTNPCR